MKGRQKGQNKFNNYVAVLCVWITFLVGSYQKEVGGVPLLVENEA